MIDRPKPGIGETVHYYDPSLLRRIGFAHGYGDRGAGPYAAIVVNDLQVGLDLFVLFPALQPAYVREKVVERPEEPMPEGKDTPYWDYVNAAQKARAQKAFNEKHPKAA